MNGGVVCHSLPDSGGVLDQDDRIMTAFQVIKAEVYACLREQHKKDSK